MPCCARSAPDERIRRPAADCSAPRSIAVVGRRARRTGRPPVPEARASVARSGRCIRAGPRSPACPASRRSTRCPGSPTPCSWASTATPRSQSMRTLAQIGAGGAVCYGSGFAESGDGELQDELIEAAAGDAVPRARTATASSTRSTGSRCGPTSTAAASSTVARRSSRRAATSRSTSRSSSAACDWAPWSASATRPASAWRTASRRSSTTSGSRASACSSRRSATRSSSPSSPVAPPSGACRSWHCRPDDRPPVRRSPPRTPGRCPGARPRTTRCSPATASPPWHTPAELVETLKLLDRGGPLRGGSIVSLSCSGGEASLVADRAEGGPLVFDDFTDEHRPRIESTLTELVTVSNPFDYHTFMWGDRAAMARVLHGRHGRSAGRDHAGARRATRARQRSVRLVHRCRRAGRRRRAHRRTRGRRGDPGRVHQRAVPRPSRPRAT